MHSRGIPDIMASYISLVIFLLFTVMLLLAPFALIPVITNHPLSTLLEAQGSPSTWWTQSVPPTTIGLASLVGSEVHPTKLARMDPLAPWSVAPMLSSVMQHTVYMTALPLARIHLSATFSPSNGSLQVGIQVYPRPPAPQFSLNLLFDNRTMIQYHSVRPTINLHLQSEPLVIMVICQQDGILYGFDYKELEVGTTTGFLFERAQPSSGILFVPTPQTNYTFTVMGFSQIYCHGSGLSTNSLEIDVPLPQTGFVVVVAVASDGDILIATNPPLLSSQATGHTLQSALVVSRDVMLNVTLYQED